MQARSFVPFLAAAALALVGCDTDVPTGDLRSTPTQPAAFDRGGVHDGGEFAGVLNDLRAATARWHDLDVAMADGYTAEIGCVDERNTEGVTAELARGMGYHFAKVALLDDEVDLLEPELVVYGKNPQSGQLQLAAFDYFVPASATWPSPEDGGTPPTMPDIGRPFTWSAAFGGWMFHIWPWWQNPDGLFSNWNPSVPTCECEISPSVPACIPD